MERILDRLREWKFRLLLLSVAMLVIIYPMLQSTFDARIFLDILVGLVFLASLHIVFQDRRLRVAAFALGLPTFVGVWIHHILPGVAQEPLEVAFHSIAAAFFFFTIIAILRMVHREKIISVDSVCGALCGYLLVGLAFGHIYCVVDVVAPGSFKLPMDLIRNPTDQSHRHFALTYFSFVTLATVGYGDITPASGAARSLAIAEAVVGQFYLAVLIAELIGKRVSQAIIEQQSRSLE